MLIDCNFRYLIVCGMILLWLDRICKLSTSTTWIYFQRSYDSAINDLCADLLRALPLLFTEKAVSIIYPIQRPHAALYTPKLHRYSPFHLASHIPMTTNLILDNSSSCWTRTCFLFACDVSLLYGAGTILPSITSFPFSKFAYVPTSYAFCISG